MKIAINALPYTSYQGIESFLAGLLHSWPETKDEVTVFANEKSAAFLKPLPSHIKLEIKNFSNPSRLRLFVYQQLCLPQILRKEKFDFLFCPSLDSPWIFSKKIVALYDAAPFIFKNESSLIGKMYWRTCLFFAKNFSQEIITISEFSRREISQHLHIKTEKIKIIYGGLPTPPKQTQEKNENSAPINKPYFVAIGNARARKNLETLIKARLEASGKFQDCELLIIGKMDKSMEKLVAMAGAGIRFTGFVDEQEKYRLLGGAQALIFPSLYEGFGIPILEAQISKIPVLCSDIPAFREVAADSVLFFDGKNPVDINDKINQLLNQPELAARLVVKGEINTHRFSWKKSSQQLIDLIHQHENSTNK